MKKLLLLSTIFILSSLIISAQTPQPLPKQINGGVLNGKAISLQKPSYPSAAKAVKASGAVSVQVLIDEQGNVVSASAVSGHPLLRQAAEQAALASKFAPTTLSGQPVKVSGIITYNFVSEITTISMTGNWYQTGMALSALEKMPTLRYFDPSMLIYIIPADWTAEREQIARLSELKKDEMQIPDEKASKERVIDERMIKTDDAKEPIKLITTRVGVSPEQKVSSESNALAQSLISSIRGRLAGKELDLWYFNLGVGINQALSDADSRSEEKRVSGVKPFREFLKTAPTEVSEDILMDLGKIASLAEKGIFSDQDNIAVTQLMMKLNTMR